MQKSPSADIYLLRRGSVARPTTGPGAQVAEDCRKLIEKVHQYSDPFADFEETGHINVATTQRRDSVRPRRSLRLSSLVSEDYFNFSLVERAEIMELTRQIDCIVVAMNLSKAALRAFETILPFAIEENRKVHLVRCLEANTKSANLVDLRDEARMRCETLAMEHRMMPHVDAAVQQLEVKEDVATGILKKANNVGADLIVIGTTRSGSEPLRGHVCETLVRHSTIPVCVVRNSREQKFSASAAVRMMVSVDGSILSLCALRYACRLATAATQVYPAIVAAPESRTMAMTCDTIASINSPCQIQEPFHLIKDPMLTIAQNLSAAADQMGIDFLVVGSDVKGFAELGCSEATLVYLAHCHVLIFKNQWLNDGQRSGMISRTGSWSSSKTNSFWATEGSSSR